MRSLPPANSALALTLSLRDAHLPLPGRVWCVSPWDDLAMTGRSFERKAAIDPFNQKGYLGELARAYLGGTSELAPLVSPLYGDLRGLPHVLIQVGSAETLLDDSVRLAGALGEADVAATWKSIPIRSASGRFLRKRCRGQKSACRCGALHA